MAARQPSRQTSRAHKVVAPQSGVQAVTDHLMSVNYTNWFFGKDKLTDIWIPALAEYVASAFFIFIACGAGMNTTSFAFYAGSVQVQIALAFGFTITALAFTIGHISGGHINFAVTFAFVVAGRISPVRGMAYFVGQLLGGITGSLLLKALMPQSFWPSCFASNFLAPEISQLQGFFIEFFLTFFLLFVVSAATDSQKSEKQNILTPLAIGLCIFCAHMVFFNMGISDFKMVGIPVTGTSINPTRTFATAIAASGVPGCEHVWDNHYIFWLAPILGGVFATYMYQFAFATTWGESLTSQYRDDDEDMLDTNADVQLEDVQHQAVATDVNGSGSAVDYDPRYDQDTQGQPQYYDGQEVPAHNFDYK